MKEFFLVLLGWGLGLASNRIAECLTRKRKRNDLIQVLSSDLMVFKNLICVSAMEYARRAGPLTPEFLGWLHSKLVDVPVDQLDPKRKLEIEAMSRLTQAQLDAKHTASDRDFDFLAKSFILPVFETHQSDFPLLREDQRRRLARIMFRLHQLNQGVEHQNRYFFMTFDPGIEGGNREALTSNVDGFYMHISGFAVSLGNDVDALLKDLNATKAAAI